MPLTPSRCLICLLAALSLASTAPAADWTNLLDQKLTHWRSYLGFRHQPDYTGREPVDAAGKKIEPVGYDRDPAGVFTVSDDHGQPVLRVSGEIYGALISREEYANFQLKAKVKWGNILWPPRTDKLRDSGILYYSNGPAGIDYWRAWMLAQEFQIMEGHLGDYWNISNAAIDIRAYLPEGAMNAVASATQPFRPFGARPSLGGFCLRSENFEKPRGEWNEIELVCFEGRSLHLVNGHVVMVLRNSRTMTNGQAAPLTKGALQLQSEASEVYYSALKIRPLDKLPAEYAKYFAE